MVPSPQQYWFLRLTHAAVALILLVTAITFATLKGTSTSCAPMMRVSLERWGNATDNTSCVPMVTLSHAVGWLDPAYLSIFSMVWSGLVNLSLATVFVSSYRSNLEKAQFPFRWLDYIVSAPPMLVGITSLCGVTEVWVLVGAGMACFCTIILGAQDDYRPAGNTPLRVTYWVIASAILLVGGLGPGMDALRLTPNIPGAALAITLVLMLVFASFGVVQLVQIVWPRYTKECELTFCILGLTAKVMLGTSVYTGGTARGPTGEFNNTHVTLGLALPLMIGIVWAVGLVYLWRKHESAHLHANGAVLERMVRR